MGSSFDYDKLQKMIDEGNKNLQRGFDAKLEEQRLTFEKTLKESLEKSLQPVKLKVERLETKVNGIDRKFTELDDISNRVRNLQLNLVPFREGEDLNGIFRALSSKLGYEVPPQVMVRRFYGQDNEKRPILISFATEMSKIEFLHHFKTKSADMKRSIFPNFAGDETRIYLQHDFTSTQYQLHKTALKFFKDKLLNKIIVRAGNKIMIQIEDNEKFQFFPDATSLNAEIERRKSAEPPALKNIPKKP